MERAQRNRLWQAGGMMRKVMVTRSRSPARSIFSWSTRLLGTDLDFLFSSHIVKSSSRDDFTFSIYFVMGKPDSVVINDISV